MHWLDFVVLIILLGATGIEMSRGFGRAVMDALCLYGALKIISVGVPVLAAMPYLHTLPGGSVCWAYGLMLVACSGLALAFAYYLHDAVPLDAGMFDRVFGLAAGMSVGMMIAHGFVSVIALSQTGDADGSLLVASSFLGNEMLSFTTYHSLLSSLTGTPSLHRDLPS